MFKDLKDDIIKSIASSAKGSQGPPSRVND